MIQRIQTLYLSLTAILSFLFLNGSFLNFTDQSGFVIKVTFSQIIRETSAIEHMLLEKTISLPFLIILIPVLSVIAILLFNKRSLQIWLVRFLIIIVVAFIIVSSFLIYIVITKYDSEMQPGLKMLIPFLQLVFLVLAYRGIKKDDNLVKSYDRLR